MVGIKFEVPLIGLLNMHVMLSLSFKWYMSIHSTLCVCRLAIITCLNGVEYVCPCITHWYPETVHRGAECFTKGQPISKLHRRHLQGERKFHHLIRYTLEVYRGTLCIKIPRCHSCPPPPKKKRKKCIPSRMQFRSTSRSINCQKIYMQIDKMKCPKEMAIESD